LNVACGFPWTAVVITNESPWTATSTSTITATATQTRTATHTRTATPTATFEEPTLPIQAPDIVLKKVFTTTCHPGGTTQFKISITNQGNIPTSGPIFVTDPIPATMTLILPPIVSPAVGWNCGAGQPNGHPASTPHLLSCTFTGILSPGDPALTITVNANVTPGSIILLNQATADTTGDLDTGNNTDIAQCRAGAVPAPALSPEGVAGALLALGAVALLAMRRRRTQH